MKTIISFIFILLFIFVIPVFAGTSNVTLQWDAPTTNVDGTPLTDLAGYKVYYGNESGNYTNNIDVNNITTYEITNLADGTYYFAVTAYDTSGNESDYSNEVNKTLDATSPSVPGGCTIINITINKD